MPSSTGRSQTMTLILPLWHRWRASRSSLELESLRSVTETTYPNLQAHATKAQVAEAHVINPNNLRAAQTRYEWAQTYPGHDRQSLNLGFYIHFVSHAFSPVPNIFGHCTSALDIVPWARYLDKCKLWCMRYHQTSCGGGLETRYGLTLTAVKTQVIVQSIYCTARRGTTAF